MHRCIQQGEPGQQPETDREKKPTFNCSASDDTKKYPPPEAWPKRRIAAVVHWIGGLAFVTLIVLPLGKIRSTAGKGHAVERRLSAQVRFSIPVAGAIGLWMTYRMDLWGRSVDPQFWWMSGFGSSPRQRRRWFHGLVKTVLYAPVKLRWRFGIGLNTMLWALAPIAVVYTVFSLFYGVESPPVDRPCTVDVVGFVMKHANRRHGDRQR
jgi:hypothetical protein